MKKNTLLLAFFLISISVFSQQSNFGMKLGFLSAGATYDPGAPAFGGALQLDYSLSSHWTASTVLGYNQYQFQKAGVVVTNDESSFIDVGLAYNLTGSQYEGRNNIRFGFGATYLHNSLNYYEKFSYVLDGAPIWENTSERLTKTGNYWMFNFGVEDEFKLTENIVLFAKLGYRSTLKKRQDVVVQKRASLGINTIKSGVVGNYVALLGVGYRF